MGLRILSWNINGLRSFKTDMKDFLSKLDADIICFQETKVTRDMLEEPLAIVEGYSSYFSFSRKRSGYSGVATFCSQKATPLYAQEGLSGILGGDLPDESGSRETLGGHWTEEELKDLDSEGRAIITQHTIKGSSNELSTFAVINVYCPRADPERPERKVYKLKFYELLRQRAAAINATGCHVVIVGDINTSHKRIDHCDPDENEDFELRLGRRYLDKFLIPLHKDGASEVKEGALKNGEDTSCQNLPHSENFLKLSESEATNNCTDMLDESGFENEGIDEYLLESASDFQVVDTFRYFYPNRKEAFTCWNTFTNARATNYGTRIDYIFCDKSFLPFVEDSSVLQDVMGSDHCPVSLKTLGEVIPSEKLPCICTKYFPEFKGNQQKLSSYFQPKSLSSASNNEMSNSQSLLGSKRKHVDSDNKTLVSKKSASDKQIKLDSFFVSKPKGNESSFKCSSKDDEASVNGKACSLNVGEKVNNFHVENSSQQSKLIATSQTECKISQDFLSQKENDDKGKSIGNTSASQSKKQGWGFLMKGPKPPPLCPGHKEPAAVRTVKKKGPNMNKQFYACARGAGREGDPNAQCNFFQWVGKK